MVKCVEFDKFRKQAHAYCILENNKEMVYQLEVLKNDEFEDL